MIGFRRALLAASTVALFTSCADDGNDVRSGGWSTFPTAPPGAAVEPTAPAPTRAPTSGADADVEPTGATTGAGAAVEPTGVVVPVIALDNSFRPEVVEITVGDEVLWENRGLNEHNVLYVEGDDWGIEVEGFQPGDVYSYVFTEPGEYRYYCSIHGSTEVGMIGTVVVSP